MQSVEDVNLIRKICKMLKCKPDEIPTAIERLQKRVVAAKQVRENLESIGK